MRKISDSVKNIVKNSTFLSEVLSEGVGNISLIARKIKPKVEKELLQKVSEESIAMALRRMPKMKSHRKNITEMFKGTFDIAIRSNLLEFIYFNEKNFLRAGEKILKSIGGQIDFANTVHGVSESIVIINKDKSKLVENLLKAEGVKFEKIENLSAITIKMFRESIETPGVYFELLRLLAWENINLIEVISTGSEVSLILETRDIDKAFSTIKSIL